MVENVVGQCGRAAVTRVASSRVELRACRVRACRGVHVVGVKPCAAPAPCPAHYGLCLPVLVTITDPVNALGTLRPDKDAILEIVENNRKKNKNICDAEKVEELQSHRKELVKELQESDYISKNQPIGADVDPIELVVENWAKGIDLENTSDSQDCKGEREQYKELVGTLAELAAEKRAGRVAPGPEPPSGAPRHHEAVQLFSELMQSDDVSTIAAQIANQAELIYQTWKTTGLNPKELIRYHSVTSDGSLLERGEQAATTSHAPSKPSTVKPRTPVRSISPAPPGSSPAVPRKVLDPSLHNGRPHINSATHSSPVTHNQIVQNQSPYNQSPQSASPVSQPQSPAPHAASPVRTLNTSPRPYVPPGSAPQSPGVHQQQQPVYPNSAPTQAAPQSPRLSYSSPPSPSLNQGGPRPYVSPAAPQSPKGSVVQPPPPPERSSSYSGVDSSQHPQQQYSPFDILGDPEFEASLQEFVNTFVIEDKARHHTAAVAALASQRPKSEPSSIQEALQRFERQMAITSRVAAQAADNLSNPSSPVSQSNTMNTLGRFSQQQMSNSVSSSSTSSTNTSMSINTIGRRYGGTRSDSAVAGDWTRMQMDHDARSRRSISPNPPVSQPGWNEGPTSNTSTWPLKHKQPSVLEKKTVMQSHSSSSHISTSSSSSSSYSSSNITTSTSTNYITTLEARVESSSGQKYSGVPLRHKVVTMSAVDQEKEKLMNALRTRTLIDDGDCLRPLDQTRPISAPVSSTHMSAHTPSSPISNSVFTSASSNSVSQSNATEYSAQNRRPKYSISVTVDVDNPAVVQNQNVLQQQPQQQQQQQQQQQVQIQKQQVQQSEFRQTSSSVSMRTTQQRVQMKSQVDGDMSAVDFAKVRFQESQQHPHSSQRLDDYRNISSKQVVSSDGRVMMARTRFENGSTSLSDSTWRGTLGIQADEVGSTLPEFYRRKLRKMRKAGSPEPLVAGSISALPHPELTDQQKAHIRERSQSPTTGYNSAGVAIRPFLTQGSVAERVLIFERAPAEMKPKPGAPTSGPHATEKRRTALSTWRDPNEVRSLAQEGVVTPVSPPSPVKQIEAPPPSTTSTTTTASITANTTNAAPEANATTTKQLTYVRDSVSATQKENERPLVTSPPSTPVSSLSPTPQSVTPTAAAPTLAHAGPASPVGVSAAPSSTPFHSTAPRPTNTTLRRHTKAAKNLHVPRFYFPTGRPTTQAAQEQAVSRVNALFRENGGQIMKDNMEPLMRACQLPLYWKAPLFIAAGGDKLGYLTQEQFSDYWSRVISNCHDMASRFVRVLSRGVRNYLLPDDFLTMIQDVVDTHPGLTFLKEATEFHSRYVHTVIARIYYCVNRSWSGKITVPELRRSNLLQVISFLEEEEDINQITDYFSYEHFYVIYCKFWELDTDHDLFIDKNDLARHNERALSWRMIERIFSGAVTRGRVQKQDRMGYSEFVWFLISEEDKRHATAIEYWFRCMDLDGDGYLSMYELEYFYEEQLQRMEALGIETLPFHDCLCQMLDMVRPEKIDKISLRDLKKCRMTPIFFDTFFNLEKYLDHEQRDPFASHRADDDGQEVSDWDRYAAEEYELLVSEENGTDHQDDVFYGDEDELSMGCDDALDSTGGGGSNRNGGVGNGGALNKHSPLSATVTNLAADPMDVDDDYPDYADSDDYQY